MSGDIACVDLFCGAGGLTHGLEAGGVPVVAGVDSDDACRWPYEANNLSTEFHARDVAELTADELTSWFGGAGLRVLAGCAPCQPFSSYTRRDKAGRDRWSLLSRFAQLVEATHPEVVTMENVPAVRKHGVFRYFVGCLENCGYEVWHEVVDCADYGLPQRRRRTVLLASLVGPLRLPEPTSGTPATVRTAIAGLPQLEQGERDDDDPLHVASRLSSLNLRRIQASRPGGTWHDWPDDLIVNCHRRATGSTYQSVYGRMRWDAPAPTLTTQFYGYGNGRFGHPDQDRGLSLREGAILQGFPSSYAFTPRGVHPQFKTLGRLIGNAVPYNLGYEIGRAISAINGHRTG